MIVIEKGDVKCLRITSFGEGKRLKTESSERLVPISDKLKPYLESFLKVIRQAVFSRNAAT